MLSDTEKTLKLLSGEKTITCHGCGRKSFVEELQANLDDLFCPKCHVRVGFRITGGGVLINVGTAKNLTQLKQLRLGQVKN